MVLCDLHRDVSYCLSRLVSGTQRNIPMHWFTVLAGRSVAPRN